MKLLCSLLLLVLSISPLKADPSLINGQPVGDLFKGVGTFNLGCTITKVGKRQFISAAHCVSKRLPSLYLQFKDFKGSVRVRSSHIHPSWIKDCGSRSCNGTEVGSSRMTPGRADVVLINVAEETPSIPVINIGFSPMVHGTEVALVGAGCTRGIEPGGRGKMRYALTNTIPSSYLVHNHSLYREIAEVSGMANWVTPGYGLSTQNSSLCPGDSGGPMLTRNAQGDWEIVGIAADYTFNGPYRDGDITVTNLHTRLDDQSYYNVGEWIRSVWSE